MSRTERRRHAWTGAVLHWQRDKAHRGKRCPEAQSGGCTACVTGYAKRPARRRDRHRARTAVRSFADV